MDKNILGPLEGANQLSEVELHGNPIGGEIIVDYLKESADTLQTLTITVNGERQNIVDKITAYWHANNQADAR